MTCNEEVRGDMGLETLKSHRDKTKLKWWYKLASMSVRRYPRQVFDQEWKVKPRRGRQRKPWNKYVDELFDVLGLPKGEFLDDLRKEQCPLSLFLSNVNERVSNSASKKYLERLNSKVKLELYKTFDKEVEFKRYLHGVSDAGNRLLFKFRSGTHGLNEELGRHRGRNGRTECVLCGDERENVVHVLWECPAYKDSREEFLAKLRATLGEAFKDFEALDNIERASFTLGCELWMENFDSILALVKEYITDVWEVRKVTYIIWRTMLYPASVSVLSWGSEGWHCGWGPGRGKFGKFSHSGRVTGKLHVQMMIRVELTPPTLGAWSMAGLLGQPLEYYYNYY